MEQLTRRQYIVTKAMSLNIELLDIKITDDDVVKDDNGNLIKSTNGEYFQCNSKEMYGNVNRYKLITTHEYRLVRYLYKIADEVIDQEKIW